MGFSDEYFAGQEDGFVGIVEDGEFVSGSNFGPDRFDRKGEMQETNIDGVLIFAKSTRYIDGFKSMIQIGGIDYALNTGDLNIVVYDKNLKKVVDNVCFDFHDNYSCVRNNY